MLNQNILSALTIILIGFSAQSLAQSHEHSAEKMNHENMLASVNIDRKEPMETGQAAFAAISEIVEILENDAETDWATVNIDALREHLLDMDRLTSHTTVMTTQSDTLSIQFRVTGTGQTVESIHRMVPAHADMVRKRNSWLINVTPDSQGVTMTVKTRTTLESKKLSALGFFGFMTIGAHHQAHHLQIARGQGH